MSHPLFTLASNKEVRQAAGFRKVATELTGEALAVSYGEEKAEAPRLHEAGRRYFVKRSGKPATERRNNKDEEHLGSALVRHCRAGTTLSLPEDGGSIDLFDYQIRAKAGPADEPSTKGIGRFDLIGLDADDRLVVVAQRYVEPTATRCRVGDTPLRLLLEGLGYCAIASANAEEIGSEIQESFGRTPSDAPPLLLLLASPRYWELCRKREAQKGAAWIKEIERLAQEIEPAMGVTVRYLGLSLEGDPGWHYGEEGPELEAPPKLAPSWEILAGRVKPRARPRPKAAPSPENVIVEADLSRPVRPYVFTESYDAGDRIDHAKLGTGVVQGVAGSGKIRVRFDEKQLVLVHERPS